MTPEQCCAARSYWPQSLLTHHSTVHCLAVTYAAEDTMYELTSGWFDIKTLDRSKRVDGLEDEAGLMATVDKIDQLIQLEVDKGIPEDKIVLGGFSQGGAIAALSLLLKNRNLAGYIALSTWIPMPEKVVEQARPNAKEYPVFWGHGTDDQVVRYECECPLFPSLLAPPLFLESRLLLSSSYTSATPSVKPSVPLVAAPTALSARSFRQSRRLCLPE